MTQPLHDGRRRPVVNAMTVDVEDWFQVQAFAHCIPRTDWDGCDRRVEANVDRILALFDAAGVRATFFTLGWIAERHPAMVRRIVAGGHELASHGWEHIRADTQDPAAFRADVERTRLTLEDIGGVPVVGYRAATFSIGAQNQWAFRVLEDAGYAYSSSINPIRHDLYGMPDAPRTPFRPEGGALWEIPMTTVAAFGRNWPCSGGGFFRLLPYEVYRRGLATVNRRNSGRGFLFPSVGDRSRAAARRRLRLEVPPAALHQSLAHAGQTGTRAAGLRLGPHGPRVRAIVP